MDEITYTDAAHPRFRRFQQVTSSGFRIALVQLAVCADKTQNIAHAVKEIHRAKQLGAQLVALPECFNSPYGTKYFEEYAEEIPSGPTSEALSRAARDTGLCVVGGTVPERHGSRLYNTCTVWSAQGDLVAKHRKVHLFDIDIPGKITFKESEVLSPGDELTTFDFNGIKIGLGICYDLRFEEMARLHAAQGCSVLIYPGAFNMTTGPRHWELLGRARATDQQLWVALVSPARDPHASYVAWGHSSLVDPWGQLVGKLEDQPDILMGDIENRTRLVDQVRELCRALTQIIYPPYFECKVAKMKQKVYKCGGGSEKSNSYPCTKTDRPLRHYTQGQKVINQDWCTWLVSECT